MFSWLRYQYYWSFYADTGKSVLMLTPATLSDKVFELSTWYDPAGDRTIDLPHRDRRSTTLHDNLITICGLNTIRVE